MALSFLPVTARLRHRLHGTAFEAEAVAVETIAPAIVRPSPAALSLPDDRGRIRGWQEETTPEIEDDRIAGRAAQHGATIIAHYRNVRLIDGVLYGRSGMSTVANRPKRRPVVIGVPDRIECAQLCVNPVIDRYFGHWLLDGLLLEEMARRRGVPALTTAGHRWLHEPGYRDLVHLRPDARRHAVIAELSVVDDRGLNDDWRDRALALRARVRAVAGTSEAARPVFIQRGSTGAHRMLVNEDALIADLTARGFAIVDPEREAPVAIAAKLANAPLVVAVEGSSQYHAMLAVPDDAWIVTIMPPHRMNAITKVHADAIGLNWAYTVADDAGDGGFHQPPDRLLRLIDLTRA